MGVDLKLLARRGVNSERLQLLCSSDPEDRKKDDPLTGKPFTPEVLKRWDETRNRIRSRVQEGMARNFTDWKWAYALDIAWETPFHQLTPTMLHNFMSADLNGEGGAGVLKVMQGLGLEKFVVEEKDPKVQGEKGVKRYVNPPAFFNILVPLVISYVKIVWAQLFNSLNQSNFLKYDPAKETTLARIICEIVTDRMSVMASQYSYVDVLKQAILKTLQYGRCIQFLLEEWNHEEELRLATAEDVANGVKNLKGDPCALDDEIEVVTREGNRHKHPHPSRYYWDIEHPAYTINSDSGCMFGGMWEVVRYSSLLGKGYWNISRINIGNTSIIDQNQLFFQTAYAACRLTIPTHNAGVSGVGTPNDDREKQLGESFYNTDKADSGVLTTNHFEKLIPSECGLGDYPYPVWFRFVLAGDGCTILWAAPLPANPMIYYGYDANESLTRTVSMALEIVPFQDHFSMMLTQIILSAKQNLANLSLLNTDILDPEIVARIRNTGEGLYRKVNIYEASFRRLFKLGAGSGNAAETAIQSFTLPRANTAELVNVLKTILSVLERVLNISALELGQSASHEQPAREISGLMASANSKIFFTATPFALAIDAWKRQSYEYWMAFGDIEFFATIPTFLPTTDEINKILGIEVNQKGIVPDRDKFIRVKANRNLLRFPLHEFAATVINRDSQSDSKAVAALSQVLGMMLKVPPLMEALTIEQIIEITNILLRLSGAPRDFKLKVLGKPGGDKAAAQQQLQQVLGIVTKVIDKKVMQDIEPILAHTKQNTEAVSKIIGIMQQAGIIAPSQNGQPNQPNGTDRAAIAA